MNLNLLYHLKNFQQINETENCKPFKKSEKYSKNSKNVNVSTWVIVANKLDSSTSAEMFRVFKVVSPQKNIGHNYKRNIIIEIIYYISIFRVAGNFSYFFPPEKSEVWKNIFFFEILKINNEWIFLKHTVIFFSGKSFGKNRENLKNDEMFEGNQRNRSFSPMLWKFVVKVITPLFAVRFFVAARRVGFFHSLYLLRLLFIILNFLWIFEV